MQINQLLYQTAPYPELLAQIASPPTILHTLGDLPKGPYIAVVGTRRPTSYGKNFTYQIAGELATAGFTIVSGLATGIDATAHQAALDAGGNTVAVLGHGLDRMYPATNRDLAKRILAAGGALVTEFPVETVPYPNHFVMRNRVISGLSLGVIFTEGDEKSGALHTINYALDQGRDIFALPGSVHWPMSIGPNNILREGGMAVTGSHDVLAYYKDQLGLADIEVTSAYDPREQTVIELLKGGRTTTQQLIEAGGFSPSELADVMSLMEITGKLRNLGAGQWAPRAQRKPQKKPA